MEEEFLCVRHALFHLLDAPSLEFLGLLYKITIDIVPEGWCVLRSNDSQFLTSLSLCVREQRLPCSVCISSLKVRVCIDII